MAAIRILIVDDSPTVRNRLREVLAGDPDCEIVGEAGDGKAAIELCQDLRPNIVTMDMMMPTMTGLAATEYIMAHFPTPILIVSSSTNRGELFKTYDALAAGAVDVLEKPFGDETDAAWEARFIQTIKLVSRIRVITHPRARLSHLSQTSRQTLAPSHKPISTRTAYKLVAIGVSTGGPGAVVEVLKALPSTFALPILLVMHIGEPFGVAFAEWLDGQTGIRVTFARDGEWVAAVAGRVVMAPPDCHLVVRNGRTYLTLDPERHSCRPSVDVLFESVAREYGPEAVGCLMTGMGKDGALGLLEMRRAGGLTLAQDEATSIVYGMPREAAILKAAESILPLHEIGHALADLSNRMLAPVSQ